MVGFSTKIISVFFGILAAIAFVLKIKSGFILGDTAAAQAIELLTLAVIISLIIVLGFKGKKIYDRIRPVFGRLSVGKMIVILFCVSLITKLAAILIYHFDETNDYDILFHWKFAVDIVNGGKVLDNGIASSHPYSLFFSLLLVPAVAIFGSGLVFSSAWLSLLISIAAIFTFATVKELYGKNVAFVSVLIWILIPEEIILPQWYFHELALVIFMPVCFWCLFVGIPKAKNITLKIGAYLLFAFALLTGSMMSPLGKVYMIALAICAIIKAFAKKEARVLIRCGVIVLTIIIVFLSTSPLLSAVQKAFMSDDNLLNSSASSGMAWYTIFAGSVKETGGSWSAEEAEKARMFRETHTEEEIKNYYPTKIKENYSYFFSHPIEYLKFLSVKIEKTWYSERIQETYAAAWNKLYSKTHLFTFSYTHIIYSVLMFIAIASISFKKLKENTDRLLYPILFIGFTLIFLVIEIHGRYVSHFQIILIIMGVAGLKDYCSRASSLIGKLKKRTEKNADKSVKE